MLRNTHDVECDTRIVKSRKHSRKFAKERLNDKDISELECLYYLDRDDDVSRYIEDVREHRYSLFA